MGTARYKKILDGFDGVGVNKVKFPHYISNETKSLVTSLCQKQPFKRLPMLPGGVKENVYTHSFYSNPKILSYIDFDLLKTRQIESPDAPIKHKKNAQTEPECAPEGMFGAAPSRPYFNPRTNWEAEFDEDGGDDSSSGLL